MGFKPISQVCLIANLPQQVNIWKVKRLQIDFFTFIGY